MMIVENISAEQYQHQREQIEKAKMFCSPKTPFRSGLVDQVIKSYSFEDDETLISVQIIYLPDPL